MPDLENSNSTPESGDIKSETIESIRSFQDQNSQSQDGASQSREEHRADSNAKTGSEETADKNADSKEKTSEQVSSVSDRENLKQQPQKSRSQLKVEAEIAERKRAEDRALAAERRAEDFERRWRETQSEIQKRKSEERPRYFFREPPQRPKTSVVNDDFYDTWTRADIENQIAQYSVQGDEVQVGQWRAVLREYDQVDKFKRQYSEWERTEGSHKQAYDNRKSYFDKILGSEQRFSWLKDRQSPETQELIKLCNDEHLRDVIQYLDKQPEGLYVMASWALDKIKASRSDALEAKVKELEAEKQNGLKARVPIQNGSGSEQVASPTEDNDGDPKSSLMKNLRSWQDQHGGPSLKLAR